MIEKGIIQYEIDDKLKKTIVTIDDYGRKGVTTKKKGAVFVKNIGILVALMKLMSVEEENIDKIVSIIRDDFRNKKGYSKKI
ncbi:hypothetical protein ACSW8S_17580 (plasmid) [Clostridium perfringens]